MNKETKMLYLTNSELKGGYPVPAKQWLEIALKSMEDVANYKKEGKVVLHVGYAGRQAGSIVWNVDSHEELMQVLSQLPFWPFMEWEIIPLLST
jgi:muconolactone delta-isomerase